MSRACIARAYVCNRAYAGAHHTAVIFCRAELSRVLGHTSAVRSIVLLGQRSRGAVRFCLALAPRKNARGLRLQTRTSIKAHAAQDLGLVRAAYRRSPRKVDQQLELFGKQPRGVVRRSAARTRFTHSYAVRVRMFCAMCARDATSSARWCTT